jgi:DNA helicase IV
VKADELALEQKYFDRALECREASRAHLRDAPGAAVGAGAAAGVKSFVDDRIEKMGAPDSAVAVGRLDLEPAESRYIGRDAIWEGADVLVVSWQARAAAPFYTASVDDPVGVSRKRTFKTEGNTVVDFEDLVFEQLAEDIAALDEPSVSDALLDDLKRSRTGEMHEIVATIQAAQYELLRSDLDQLLVVQGGPGTGKTVVALHRVSWLLYNHPDRLSSEQVLVVGPSSTFVRYIRGVLPALGDRDIDQRDLAGLAPKVRLGRHENADLTRLKGEPRMKALIERGLRDRIGLPDDELELTVPGRSVVRFDRKRLAEQVGLLRNQPYTIGRTRLRAWFRDELAKKNLKEVPAELLDNVLDRIWPNLTAAAFLRELFGSEGRLLRAAGDDFSAREVQRLYRRSAERISQEQWAPADLPLLDYAEEEIAGRQRQRYGHIVVDEAQDLSPMELSMLKRRSLRGSMTVLGDLAQSSGQWARESWDDVIDHLRGELPAHVEHLEYGYRVPRQIFELASRVLPVAAPNIPAPTVVRDGPEDPRLLTVTEDERADTIAAEAMGYAAHGHSVGIISPDLLRPAVVDALERQGVAWRDADKDGVGGGINLVAPITAKGLEFDASVVVEPDAIIASEQRGERLLYVALTRSTQYLSVVYTSPPAILELDGRKPIDEPPPTPRPRTAAAGDQQPTGGDRVVDTLAEAFASDIRSTLNPEQWERLLRRLGEKLRETDRE